MSRLEELIKELCPDGVEYVKIKDCFNRLKGTPITAGKMKEIENENGEIRVFAGGKTVVNANKEDIPNANIIRIPAVLVQSRGVIDVVYFESPFTFKNEMWAYTHDEKVTVKYLFYVLKNNIQTFRDSASGMGSLPQISLPVTEEFIIPLPPLPVQEEIVRILDNFTELTAELTARKKQYEYYRDSLLTFDDEVELKTLGELCDIKTGTKPENIFDSKNEYEYINAGTTNSGYTDTFNCEGDTVTTPSRGQGGIGFVGYQKENFFLGPLCYKMQSKNKQMVLTKYIFYYLKSNNDLLLKIKNEGGVPSVNRVDLIKLPIILPSLSEQQRIVDMLDRFDTLCNDISSGLPAEIKARQQQYEYYRDKLLTFPRAELEV